MKYFLFLVCILGSISFISADITEAHLQKAVSDLDTHMIMCHDEFNITDDALYNPEEIMNHTYTEAGNEEKNRKIGCFIECFLKKEDMMEGSEIKEGKIHEEIEKHVENSILQSKFHKMAHKCIEEVKNITQECEKGFSIYTCVLEDYERRIRRPFLNGNIEDD